jgi:V/A-type H+/Na+-transporting ATPase subunit E
MTSTDRIINKIMEEARQNARKNLDEADKEAFEIMERTRDESRQNMEEMVKKAENEADIRKERMISVAGLEGRKKKLQVKQDMISKVFDTALEFLISKSDNEYEDMLVNMIAETCKDGDAEIILSKKDKGRVGQDFVEKINKKLVKNGIKGNIKLSGETRDIKGGFIIKKGDIEINNSFEAIIRMQRDKLEEIVVAVLF